MATRALLVAAVFASTLAAWTGPSSAWAADPFAFFEGCFSLGSSDQRRLAAGETVARTLDAEGREVAVLMVRPTTADAERLVAWMRSIDQLKRSPMVKAVGRFSSPPVPADVEQIALEDVELDSLRNCRTGHCDLKLTSQEITTLRSVIAEHGQNWKPHVQAAFRRLVLARVNAYLRNGHNGIGTFADKTRTTPLAETFAAILERSPCTTRSLPAFMSHLSHYPREAPPGTESFIYWSQERLSGKPVLTVTHVAMLRSSTPGLPRLLVAGKQIFATHYMNGSLNLTAIVGGGDGEPRYLVGLNRTHLDVLGGLFGGVSRMLVERRLRSEAGALLDALGRRVEGGLPR